MKIQFNGFDIEINQDDTNIAVKVMDANGKELSNNSYMQSMDSESEEEIQDADVTSVEDAAAEEGVEETSDDTESTEGDETEEEEEETEEEVGESYMPSFEDFKKKLKK